MIADVREAPQQSLSTMLGREVEISEPVLLAGAAPTKAWRADAAGEPHPAIELGLLWLREHHPPDREPVVVHGDYRIGNLVVREEGLAGVLDWEFAHLDDPVRDLAFSLVRAWRFGVPQNRLGGVGDLGPYLQRSNELTGLGGRPAEPGHSELPGNRARAIGCLPPTQP